MIKDTLGDEVICVAYDYNSQQPRYYSKYFAKINPGVYDVKLSEATAGSSAAPAFFAPNSVFDNYGL